MSDSAALDGVIAKALERVFVEKKPQKIGVAVSGGGDSMALLDLLRRWGRAELAVASVNHGLRAEAAAEIALVAEYATVHGISHDVLEWRWDGTGNLQAAARDGRRAVLRDWAAARGIAHVALGHTSDDQAETFLMRLARGSGVDGLAGMAEVLSERTVTWVRPLLQVGREDLRAYLRAEGLGWADDPSNQDPTFDRVKARQMMDTLAPLGVTADRLVQTAAHMAQEKEALHWAATGAKAQVAQVVSGDVVFDQVAFSALPEGMAARLLADALCFVSGAAYRPRFKALSAALKNGRDTALHGCLILHGKGRVVVTRELRAVQDVTSAVGEIWDDRWMLSGPGAQNMVVKVLGEEGLAQCAGWRDAGLPRQSLLASPAV